jgi:hypothetical protein
MGGSAIKIGTHGIYYKGADKGCVRKRDLGGVACEEATTS